MGLGSRACGFVALLMGAAIAGCTGGGDSVSWDLFAQPTVSGFEAEVVFRSGGTATITLTGPVLVPDRNGQAVSAYALRHRGHEEVGGGHFPEQVLYFDANLRIVVEQGICIYDISDCGDATVWWWAISERDLAPWGIWFPELIGRGQLTEVYNLEPRPLEWEAREEDNGTLRLDVSRPERQFDPARVETYWYRPGVALPNGPDLVVSTFRHTVPLSPADAMPLYPDVPAPNPRPAGRLMFDDEDVDHFRVGASHIEIVKAAVPSFGTDADVCLQSYGLDPRAKRTPEPLDPLQPPEPREAAKADVFMNEHGTVYHYVVSVVESEQGDIDLAVSSPGLAFEAAGGCERVARAPWPELGLADMKTRAEEVNISRARLTDFYFSAGSNRGPEASLSNHTWPAMAFSYMPAWADNSTESTVSYQPYVISMRPTEERTFRNVWAHPDDVFW